MLSHWDPFREISMIRESFDDLFERFFADTSTGNHTAPLSFPVDVVEMDDRYVMKASLPGVDPDSLEIKYVNHLLTIKGETAPDEEFEKAHYYLRERRLGRFERSISLPFKVDEEHIDATYEAGLLKLVLPKSEEDRPRRIPIQSRASSKVIEGELK